MNVNDLVQYKPNDEKEVIILDKKKISIDDFHLLKLLGRGSFGKVILVEKKSNKKLYAMKVLSKDMIKLRN